MGTFFFQSFGSGAQNFVQATVERLKTIAHQSLGSVERPPFDEKADRQRRLPVRRRHVQGSLLCFEVLEVR